MGIFKLIKELFEAVFSSPSPEAQKRRQIKKLESELCALQPVIYKGGLLQPNFAEAVRQLYVHAKPLDDLFAVTINSEDVRRNENFMDKLVISGFSADEQAELESLSYENRKKEVKENDASASKIFDAQRRTVNKLLSKLNTQDFLKMDVVLADLMQLADFCHFNFISILKVFDRNFTGLDPNYETGFLPAEPKMMDRPLQDLFFLSGNLKITQSTVNAIFALVRIKEGDMLSDDVKNGVLTHLKTIRYILNHIVTAQALKTLIAVAQENPSVTPALASYKNSARQKFSTHLQEYFDADERRIKQEIKDETTNSELNSLFANHPIERLEGYNGELNSYIQDNSALSLQWIRPLEIVKTFLTIYLSDSIKSLLNGIVIEGFFNNPNYKTQFSSTVYTCSDSLERIKAFEAKFETNGEYATSKIRGFVQDSYKNADFSKQLASLIGRINDEAKGIMTHEVSSLFALSSEIGDLLIDAKKAKSEIIDNLKVLLLSSRNRDNSDLLERQYPSWKIFFDVMKNYTIINVKSANPAV
ncbi:hypothetical protein HRI96_01145 [Treponema parvum]|uniref:Uncharacterized protein n=1 Tax=Treponema parvum TaxID=138851 RepID=A0A975ICB5_9SPIR|nr:DUF5312 family protein [Treponema parvum]QTQ10919.1 hypothetical protein HRI96_01145 [Treponema parvum]